ncbi:hypothetical protein AMTR_s00025p00111790 [Amborella trichopoda]|uniref:Dienelactone hydrolase domain-containing protein n=1 Tax=Amborella trichopoda TaxID=13333 RepID=W1PY30_AMBTC|nr:hypothetical protein AMTR_s00025p00111790 [Amborella trichopoda]
MAGSQGCENPPILSSSCGEGLIEEIGSLNAYVTGSPDSKLAILFISDVFGYEAPNLRKLADKVATAGYFVIVLDYFYGDPYVSGSPIQEWIKSHMPEKGIEDSKLIIAALKSKGISSIGAAGFCWGEVKCPIAIVGAETDSITPPEVVRQFEEVLLTKKKVDYFLKISMGVAHGWTVRYSVDDEIAVKRAEEAHTDMLNWFKKYVA